tara:strand:+ start:2380 stop:2787 length:408 start_codon:yes stop_codon:yes gene_type:complete
MTNLNEIEWTEAENATLLIPSAMMGNYVARVARQIRWRRRPYAQHPNALEVQWVEPRKRKWRGTVVTPGNLAMIVEGKFPELAQDLLGAEERNEATGVSIRRSRYASFAPEWQRDIEAAVEGRKLSVLERYDTTR